jgi:adenine-specific DNA-methyltransferase
MMPTQKEKGQYFTVSEKLQQYVFDLVKNKMSHLLEPSFGAGHLLKKFLEFNPAYPMTLYELDATIAPIVALAEPWQKVIYADFLQEDHHQQHQQFQTIVANPPYVKMAKGPHNLYVKFIQKCFALLAPNDGEMVFIVPSDFIKLTSAASIIETMVGAGSFTHFWFPHDENLFEGANIDVMVFRYEKGLLCRQPLCVVNDKMMYYSVRKGIITFSESENTQTGLVPLSNHFQVIVGMVSGRDSIYKVGFGNIKMLQDKDKETTWIYTIDFPTANPQINAHLLAHKEELLDRKIKVFSEKNWFEWGAPRNIKTMEQHWGKSCIYVRNMTRHKEVAFVGTVQYFGGALLCLIPKDAAVAPAHLHRVADLINTDTFRTNYTYSQRFKIGQKQLENAMIPSHDDDNDVEEYTLADDVEEYTLATATATAAAMSDTEEYMVVEEDIEEYKVDVDVDAGGYEATMSGVKECLVQDMLPKLLSIFLKKESDGRSQSANLEAEVLSAIKFHLLEKHPKWNIELSKARAFYDLKINGIYINLKLTAGKTADNSSSKKGIFYSITGQDSSYPASSTWNTFFTMLQQAKAQGRFKQVREKASEYHYLVIHKTTGAVLFKPIFDIHTYKSNPSNDLQIQWSNEFAHAGYTTPDEMYLSKVKCLLDTIQRSCQGVDAGHNLLCRADLHAEFFSA